MREERLINYGRELSRCMDKIADATDDYIKGVRNAPHATLELYLIRARAYTMLIDAESDPTMFHEAMKLQAEDMLVKWPEPLTAREIAEERLGEMADHEQEIFDKMWDDDSGAYAEVVIGLARAVDRIILGKVQEELSR